MSTLKVTHLQNESNSAPSISISNAVGGGVTFAGISTFYNSIRLGTDIEGHTSADDLTIATSGNTGMTIRSGTSNQGSLYFSDATSGGGEYAGWLRYSHLDNDITIGVAENERFCITSGGNVNIGGNYAETSHILNISDSTKPSLCLHTGTTQRADFSATTGITSIRSFSNSPFTINIGGSGETEAFRIAGNGRIGIGTNNPSNFLHVKNYTTSSNYITAENTTNGNAGVRLKNNQGDYAIFANNDLIFYDLENDAERLRITSAGNLAFPSGKGIDFSATGDGSGTVDAGGEVLDEYEEGTFNPVVTNGFGSPSYKVQAGRYTRIGNKVYVDLYFKFAAGSSANGNPIQIGGLPFNLSSKTYGGGTESANQWTRGGGGTSFQTVNNSDGNITFYGASNTNYFSTYIGGTQWATNDANIENEYIIGTFQYHAD